MIQKYLASLFAFLFSFFLIATNKSYSYKKRLQLTKEASLFCDEYKQENKILRGIDATIFIETIAKKATGDFIEEIIIRQLINSGGILVLSHLSIEDFGLEVRRMNNKLEQHLHKIDRLFFDCKHGDGTKGTFYSLINKCITHGISVVPFNYFSKKSEKKTKKNQAARKKLLAKRAYDIGKTYQDQKQFWIINSEDLSASTEYQNIPGVRDIIKGGITACLL